MRFTHHFAQPQGGVMIVLIPLMVFVHDLRLRHRIRTHKW